MSHCFYCGYKDDGHDISCPDLLRDVTHRKTAILLWEAGYEEGRDGATTASNSDPIFKLGFRHGVVQCEYMANVSRHDYYDD